MYQGYNSQPNSRQAAKFLNMGHDLNILSGEPLNVLSGLKYVLSPNLYV